MAVAWKPGMRCRWVKGTPQANWPADLRQYLDKARTYVVRGVHPSRVAFLDCDFLSFEDSPWDSDALGPFQFDSRGFEPTDLADVVAFPGCRA